MKTPPKSRFVRFLYENSLSLVIVVMVIITLYGQAVTGWHNYNDELESMKMPQLTFSEYLTSGDFIEATFENWESEFLQMALYVVLTISLRQKGSSESKKLYGEEPEDKDAKPKLDAPWPVKKGGIWLALYNHSLSITFTILFLLSMWLHAYGGTEVYNLEQISDGKPTITVSEYLTTSRFWFESLQNWQSEFLSIVAIVVLTIFLRQKGSPESKPVDAPYSETGR